MEELDKREEKESREEMEQMEQMEDRESFVFYRSFYEAVKDLPKDIRLEVLTAIIEYALYGRQPEGLKPFARGMFTLVKPNIDTNLTKYVNGQKGAPYGRRGGRPKKNSDPAESYSLPFEKEVATMRTEKGFRQKICTDFSIPPDEYEARLVRFLARCQEDGRKKGRTGHDSLDDAKSHLRYWMSKAYPAVPPTQGGGNAPAAPTVPTTQGGGNAPAAPTVPTTQGGGSNRAEAAAAGITRRAEAAAEGPLDYTFSDFGSIDR